jgi:lysophospholipase L1-like esterase
MAAAFFAAFGASYLHGKRLEARLEQATEHGKRLEARLEQATHPLYHRHADVRQFMIRAALDGVSSPIVVLGDSITEMAPLPDSACGHPVINAGVGGAATSDFLQLAPILFTGAARPHLIVVALGANDVGSSALTRDFTALLSSLSELTPRIVAVSDTSDEGVLAEQRAATTAAHVPFSEVRVTGLMSDRIHFTRGGYSEWMPAVLQAVSTACEAGTVAVIR